MKDFIINIIFLTLGVVIITIVFGFEIDDTLGWLLTSAGVFLIGFGLFYKQPIKVIFEFFTNLF